MDLYTDGVHGRMFAGSISKKDVFKVQRTWGFDNKTDRPKAPTAGGITSAQPQMSIRWPSMRQFCPGAVDLGYFFDAAIHITGGFKFYEVLVGFSIRSSPLCTSKIQN